MTRIQLKNGETMNTSKIAAKPRKTSAFKQLMSAHWIMAACYLLLFTSGPLMARVPEDIVIREPLYGLHKSLGALTMGLLTWRIFILLRVWWRKYTKRLPKFTPEWIGQFALHAALYLFMLAAPLSGFFLSNSYKSGNVPFFGITLPDIFPQNGAVVELARNLHFWLAYTFIAFVILHAVEQRKFVQATWRRFSNQILKISRKQTSS